MVAEKELQRSDLDTNQNRLLLRRNEVRRRLLPLLPPEEAEAVESGEGIMLEIFSNVGRFNVNFKYWRSSKAYVFNGSGWGSLRGHHKHIFREGNVLRFFADCPNGETAGGGAGDHDGNGGGRKFSHLWMVVAANRELMEAAEVLNSFKHGCH
ncbi:B3 domain-containing protein [Apostasia shenzhenica]|uniref:B3 domain-containing protein n=1 Tax=Apostasia shenzhenica TaxID=1088818 RepID=A0A2H9ZXU6_9ASPA|nr:B3 domain-containing protein [Apostasia shenzhenica]